MRFRFENKAKIKFVLNKLTGKKVDNEVGKGEEKFKIILALNFFHTVRISIIKRTLTTNTSPLHTKVFPCRSSPTPKISLNFYHE
jgi:hypothetical protein